ncbi:GNAT family N-acetyltransferase [Streptomyces iakyrus]|uniref:GNAT family N-acetyltransferase n=1 Tax=Streptomyces iakyrus TaxID=68219 RepID=UPI0036FD9090
MSDPEIRDDRAAGRLEAVSGGEVVGRIEYFVEPAHEGKGIAGSLARELYALAGRERSAVASLCPYVIKWAERHPDEARPADEALLAAAKDWLRAHPGRF